MRINLGKLCVHFFSSACSLQSLQLLLTVTAKVEKSRVKLISQKNFTSLSQTPLFRDVLAQNCPRPLFSAHLRI